MANSGKLEQQIAVFGESGSGKTVLISSFYGVTQEPQYIQRNRFNVVADDIGQSNRLHQNYLGMRNSAKVPDPTRFRATSYSFSIRMQETANAKQRKSSPDALHLVWHDYPGEWFEQAVSGEEEAQRRIETFRALLGSDVAFLLVDAQKLIDHAGEEERYLKSLLSNYRNGILSLKEELLPNGKPLVNFPRIWLMALSKSDLLPQMSVRLFKELLIEKACEEIIELRKVLSGFVVESQAISVCEDFMLLSSAKFNPGSIVVAEHVGLELIIPLAAMLPFERHVKWANAKVIAGKVAERLLSNVDTIAALLLGRKGKGVRIISTIARAAIPDFVEDAVKLAGDQLRKLNADAREKHDSIGAALTLFKMDLEAGEAQQILMRSTQ